MSDQEAIIEGGPGSFLFYAVALKKAASRDQLQDDDLITAVTITRVGETTMEVAITSGGEHTQPLEYFLVDLVNFAAKCGDAITTGHLEMTAGPGSGIYTAVDLAGYNDEYKAKAVELRLRLLDSASLVRH